MAETITVKFKVLEDGSLQQIGADAEKTAKSTDKASKASDNYSKKNKGVAQAGMNGTKAFSKMTSGITGGLVPAYAALAANVFAVSAAFNFFKRAADVRILQEGQIAFGVNTGFALQTVTAGLREASGGMLGFREAAEAAAIGVAKGFSPEQLEKLAVGAKKASAALGRNFEDSFDRLIRGASKAEPELLDELGITLRLADATEKYADKVGKTAKSLTAFERSQAVLLETQKQLDDMYGKMEGKTNPFVLLSKTFEDLVRAGTDFLMPMISGIANILSGSAFAAVAVFGALAISVFKTMIPIEDIKQKFADFAMGSQASVDLAVADQQRLQDEMRETKAAIEATKKSSISNAANKLGPSKSKLITSAQDGSLSDPKKIGMLKAHLKKAETQYRIHGSVRSGIFKGADQAQMQSLKLALNSMGKSHQNFTTRMKMQIKRATLFTRSQFKKLELVGTKTFSMLGRAAGRMGGAMNKAMKMAGFIGMFMMILEIGKKLMQSPMDILMAVVKGVQTIVKFALVSMGRFVDGISNAYKSIINLVIMGYNKLANTNIGEALGLKALDELDSNSTSATDAMQNLANSIDFVATVENSAAGKFIQGFQDRQVALAQAKEAYETLKKSIVDTGTELDKILKGRKQELKTATEALAMAKKEGNAQKIEEKTKALKKLNIEQERQGATTLATLGIATKYKEAMAIEDEAQRANALKVIRTELKGIAGISPEALEALNSSDPKAIEAIAFAATNAQAGVAALKDGINNLNASMKGGDLLSAELALGMLGETASATSGYFMELFGGDSVAAQAAMAEYEQSFVRAGTTAGEFKDKLTKLRGEMEALKVLTASAALVQGQYAAAFNADLAVQNLDKQIEAKQLQINAENNINSALGIKLALEMRLLAVARDKANVDSITATQGEGMGNNAASEALKAAGAGVQAQLSPMLAGLEKLGPEGELISAVVNGAFAIQDAFGAAFAEIKDGGLTMETGLAAAAAGVEAIGSMMAASSKSKIANIDSEIAAEKKRDGKSAESMAKIAVLEKKKEAAKKKAFEVDKKVKMAQTVIATARAIMNQDGNIPMMIAMGAMGAAQLAIIAGTSYQGSGTTAAVSAPSAVTMGSRSNTVDLAKGNNASGELAYMRGESGQGKGATDFTPAFAGYKHRAQGGYIVGEQGPEVFMPEVDGEIIPSGQSSKAPTNISFNIQAVDAMGVENVLIQQKGHIIRMIREAANEHGEFFLEQVREEAYER